jgi:hypothetical protein
MKPYQVETWVLEIIARVEAGQPIEDSQVELKSAWPLPEKAARQIAGHANAAQGGQILWLIGIDEKTGVTGAPYEELAEWYPQVKSNFESLAPHLTHFNIPVQGKTVAALLFDTDRAPYLYRNPGFGRHNGGPVAYEVPWRENNSTRTATRADLLRILAPLMRMPRFEILQGALTLAKVDRLQKSEFFWSIKLELYVETASEETVVIPFHRCRVSCEIPGKLDRFRFDEFSLLPPSQSGLYGVKDRFLSLTINSTSDETIIKGPGKLFLAASFNGAPQENPGDDIIEVAVSLLPVNARTPIPLDIRLVPSEKNKLDPKQLLWTFHPDHGP